MNPIQRILALALLLFGQQALATNYHFCECSTGAHASCAPGSNSNAGTSSSSPKLNPSSFDFNTLQAGDQVLYCRGGVFSQTSSYGIEASAATPTNPIIFQDYAPPSGATGTPRIEVTGSINAMEVGGYYSTDPQHGGYTFRNLIFDGNGSGNWGFWINSRARNITLEDVEITGFNIAVHISSTPEGLTNPEVEWLTIRRTNIHDNVDMGILGGAKYFLLENSTIASNNAGGGGMSHGLYFSCDEHDCRNAIIRNNLFDRNSVVSGQCTGGNVTMHGTFDGMIVEGNTIIQDTSASTCFGISLTQGYTHTNEFFTKVAIRNNLIVNLGLCAICVNTAPGVVIENNVVVLTTATFHIGIEVVRLEDDSVTYATNNAVVRNNTVVMTQPTGNSVAIDVADNTGHSVTNNAIYFGSGAASSHRCFEHSAFANYTVFDRNLCYHAGSNGSYSGTYANLAAAQAAGFDTSGLSSNPLFLTVPTGDADGWTCNVQSGSPLINAGSSAATRLGYRGFLAEGTRDIGACEYGSTP